MLLSLYFPGGDLTEPGAKVGGSGSFSVNKIVERGGAVHENLRVYSFGDGMFRMSIGHEGRREQFVGWNGMDRPAWGDKAANAPIIHFNGPMTLARYGPIYTLPRGGPRRR